MIHCLAKESEVGEVSSVELFTVVKAVSHDYYDGRLNMADSSLWISGET